MPISNLQKWRTITTAALTPTSTHIIAVINRRYRELHNGPDTMEELLDRHLVKNDKSTFSSDDDNDLVLRRRLTSNRREALSLYRDILRATRFFVWTDSRGAMWRDVLRANARKEFEEARYENDPEIVTRLLIGGRDAVEQALEKLAEKQRKQIEKDRGGDQGY